MSRMVALGLAAAVVILAVPGQAAAGTDTFVGVHATLGPWWGPGPWYYRGPWAPHPHYSWGPRYYPRYYSRAPVLVPHVAAPAPQQHWYYCQEPAGYYPHVAQCARGWQPVPVQPAQPAEPAR
jgi:hypothetical protein